MKKLALIMLVAATAASSFAQGFLDWGNQFGSATTGPRFPIYGKEVGAEGTSITGQSALGVTAGTTVYTGGLLSGTGFSFALYAGPASAVDSSALTLLVSTTFRTSTSAAQVLPKGLVTGATTQVPGVLPGAQAKFQIRAWDNVGGTITSFDLATTRGASAVVTTGALGGTDGTSIFTNPQTTGWNSFNIYVVPEPSTFVLAGLGAASLLIFRRRK